MTLPIERTWSIQSTRKFLQDLLDPKKTPRIPSEIRKRAYWCLRHYPHDYTIKQIAKILPEVFGEE